MYVILVYDVGAERVGNVFKLVKQYLSRIQNSVFEGNLSDKNYNELLNRLNRVIKDNYDTVVIFKFRSDKVFDRVEVGRKNKQPSLFVDEEMFDF